MPDADLGRAMDFGAQVRIREPSLGIKHHQCLHVLALGVFLQMFEWPEAVEYSEVQLPKKRKFHLPAGDRHAVQCQEDQPPRARGPRHLAKRRRWLAPICGRGPSSRSRAGGYVLWSESVLVACLWQCGDPSGFANVCLVGSFPREYMKKNTCLFRSVPFGIISKWRT